MTFFLFLGQRANDQGQKHRGGERKGASVLPVGYVIHV